MTEPTPPPFRHDFPLRENCDPNNPYEAFLWMLVGLPGWKGSQLIIILPWLQLISKRLWDLGARPVAPPILKYRPPPNMDATLWGHPGDWVDPDEPDRPDMRAPARQAVDALLPAQKIEHLRELAKDLTPKQLADEYRKAMIDAQQDAIRDAMARGALPDEVAP
jgi:Protein of unknown function (DUF2744)